MQDGCWNNKCFAEENIVGQCVETINVEEMWDFIQKEPWGIVYKVHKNCEVKNYMMNLQDKHCYKSNTLTRILIKAQICKMNLKDDIKCAKDMIRLWITFRIIILDSSSIWREQVKTTFATHHKGGDS